MYVIRSTMRQLKPHSLSYQDTTLADRSPSMSVEGASTIRGDLVASRPGRQTIALLDGEGAFHSGVGAGTYTFTPSASFPAELAKRGFDPVLGARPLRRTIQREIEDQLSEKILFDEVGAGQIVTVDVDNWDGEGPGEDAVFTFAGARKPPAEPDLAKAGAHSAGGDGPAAQ